MGERLAVDPQNSNIIYFGARSGNGLWKSTDAGKTFSKVSSFTAVGTYIVDPNDQYGYSSDIQGLAFITFDSTSATTGGATSRIFVGTADNTTASVYVSEDAGSTWSAVEGQPGTYFPHKCKLQPEEKALYLTYSDGTGPYDGTLGAVYRYDIAGAEWTDITPVSGSDLYFGFGGLGVDMLEAGTLVVATLNSWWPDAQIFRSTDSGKTWSRLWEWGNYPEMNYYYKIDETNAPWIQHDFNDVDTKWLGWMIEGLEINPLDSDHWLYGTGLTVYGGHDLTNWDSIHNVTVKSLANGIEEFAVQEVRSVPSGSELLAAVADDSGFTFASKSVLGTAPEHAWNNPMFTTSISVDYAGNQVKNVVRVGNEQGSRMVALSTDGGESWNLNYATDESKYGGKVAYSADADVILWSTSNAGVVRSANQATFAAVSDLPDSAVIASDKRDNKYFYAGSGSTFYVSSDSASSFSSGGTLGSAQAIRDIAAHPTTGGELYVSTDVGIFHSTDHGATFTKTAGSLTSTYQISLGVGSTADWNLYAFGTGSAGARLYASADGGASWTDIQGDSQTFGAIDGAALGGSGNEADLVYVGTNGRGVFYGQGTVSGGSSSGGSSGTTAKSSTTSKVSAVTNAATTSSASSTTLKTTTTQKAATTTALIPEEAGAYQQCGGKGWAGPTVCASDYTCKEQNDYYWQCL